MYVISLIQLNKSLNNKLICLIVLVMKYKGINSSNANTLFFLASPFRHEQIPSKVTGPCNCNF